jgi:hypothetical protein
VGIHENARVAELNVAPLGRPVAAYVSGSPSGSEPLILNDRFWFSLTDLLPILASVGARLTLWTVIVMVCEADSAPSETVNVTL